MITYIQLKQVARNRRFVIFTILFPIVWYWMMVELINVSSNTKYQLSILVLALLIGILGNSIVTFSKRIASNCSFYFLQSKISQYSIWKYLVSQLITQLVLNLVITAALVITACLLNTFSFDSLTWIILGVVNLFGIYVSIIGFTLGIIFDRVAIDAGATPLMFLLAMFIVPWNIFLPASSMVRFMTRIQKLFPSYYAYQIIQQNSHLLKNLSIFTVSFVLTLIPFLLIIAVRLIRNNN